MNDDIGVLLVFFNKPDTLKEVFEAIRLAKPKQLFLAQDGQRIGVEADLVNINKCRDVVNQIDWDCQVYRNYSEVNLTCDPRVYTAISWAFEYVDKLIIIEDDSVPNKSFFSFMNEMLNRYEMDERIQMISGIERFGENKFCKDSYYFSTINAGCAWGTWRRVWKDVDTWADCSFIENKDDILQVDHYIKNNTPRCYHDFLDKASKNFQRNKEINGIYSWEFAVATAMLLANRVAITPKVNLVKNIGVVEGAAHSGDSLNTMPRKIRKLFFMETPELEFPLKHPQYVIRDSQYEKAFEKEFCYNGWNLIIMKLEHIYLILTHRNLKEISKKIKRKLIRK